MRESKIQLECQKHAKKVANGVVILRTYSEGYPDRQFLYEGKTFFVEFKATGKKPRPTQIEAMNDLEKQGFTCFVIDNLNDFKVAFSRFKNGAQFGDIPERLQPHLHQSENQAFDL